LIFRLILLNKSIKYQNGGSNYTSTENFGRIFSKGDKYIDQYYINIDQYNLN